MDLCGQIEALTVELQAQFYDLSKTFGSAVHATGTASTASLMKQGSGGSFAPMSSSIPDFDPK